MNDAFCELILTIDTREKDTDRILAIWEFFEENGAIIVWDALPRCDYKIEGNLKGISVNLGIEHKVLTGDFFPSLNDLPSKLFEAYRYYDDVALFIEEGNYNIKNTDDNLDAWIQNPAMQNSTGAEGIGTLAMYNNFCGSMATNGIHIRSFRTVQHFPITVSGLLKSIIKPIHRGLEVTNLENDFYKSMMNVFVKFPGIGAKTAEKALKYIHNLHWLGCSSMDELQDIFGDATGRKAYQFIYNDSRKNECAKNLEELHNKNISKYKPQPKRKNKDISDQDDAGRTKSEGIEEIPSPLQDHASNSVHGDISQLSGLDNQADVKLASEKPTEAIQSACSKSSGELIAIAHDSDILKEDITLPSLSIENCEATTSKLDTHDILQSPNITGDLGASVLNPIIPSPISSTLPEPPNNNYPANALAPTVKNVVEYIRQRPRSMKEVGDYFGFSEEYCLKTIYGLKTKKKI
jgi:hypothetical protein